jgi:hypothetical protein
MNIEKNIDEIKVRILIFRIFTVNFLTAVKYFWCFAGLPSSKFSQNTNLRGSLSNL